MTFFTIVTSSLRFHWRIHAAVALGVAAATAVLAGALLIGDSVRGSLRDLTLARLGKIDEVLVLDRFFRRELAAELAAQPQFQRHFTAASPAILFPAATVQTQPTNSAHGTRLASGVQVVASDGSFWDLARNGPQPQKTRAGTRSPVEGAWPRAKEAGAASQLKVPSAPGEDEIVINQPLAEELHAKVGDRLIVRFGKADQIPADSPLGRRTDRVASLAELEVSEIIPAAELGRFGLVPSQIAPRNAYVSLAAVQKALDVADKVNAILVCGRDPSRGDTPQESALLASLLAPRLEDCGLVLKHVKLTFGEGERAETIYDYYSLSSDRMLLDPAAERTALTAFARYQAQPVLTYLANSIQKLDVSADGSPETGRHDADQARSQDGDAAAQLKGPSGPGGIPYSTITAIDPAPGGPLVDLEGRPLPPLAEDEIALTSWAAEDQQASVGDWIRVTFFEPETTHGLERETHADFRVAAIVPLREPKSGFTRRGPAVYDQRPTPANDPDLTPEVKGITDQASIADWDAPFPFDYKRIRDQDEAYWENHRTTPKAYISLAAGQKLWGSRFGKVTSIRIPAAPGLTAQSLEREFLDELRRSGERLGFRFVAVKRQGLAASSGTTPFDVLFLLLSTFIIAAALVLIWLLFRLGVEQRASEIGLLLGLGWPRPKVRRLLMLEGGLVAAIGAGLGVAGGLGYAWLMLTGLRTWWVGAVGTPFLTLHVTPLSLAIGFLLGLAVSTATIWFSLGRVKRAVVRSLLAGEISFHAPAASFHPESQATGMPQAASQRRQWLWFPVLSRSERRQRTWYPVLSRSERRQRTWYPVLSRSERRQWPIALVAAIGLLAAVGLAFFAAGWGTDSGLRGTRRLVAEAQAGVFLAAGAVLLVSLILLVVERLRSESGQAKVPSAPLARLAYRNCTRHVGRSAATMSLMASACFLIVAVSAFRKSPTDQGVGGFDLLAESALPIFEDLNSAAGRQKLLADQAHVLDGATVLSLRLKTGDDASCLNLYQPSQPRVLGVPQQMIAYFDNPDLPARFRFSASAAKTAAEKANPWRLLAEQAKQPSAPIPVVLDQNTAMYSLRLYGGVGQTFSVSYPDGTQITFRVAGLLSGSVLQGNLLIGEADFKRLFPQISGYRFFLIRSQNARGPIQSALGTSPQAESHSGQVAGVLEDRLSDEGFDVMDAYARLNDLLAVQNTYISTFQSLGALGLVLGTFGLAAVQLRSVFERRKELALLRAAGFRRARLGEMVLLENLLLLLSGLALGTLAALVTVLPQMFLGEAQVPLVDLAIMLGIVLLVGVATGMLAVRATLRAPLVAALKGE